ncbi:MAG: hypothetical protein QG670_2541, partial [Thermoproteota archaeon]|nr:hypothetical protein [Thermoproteota archaeon]
IKAISQMGFKATSLWASQSKILDEYYTKETIKGLKELLEQTGLKLQGFTSINFDLASMDSETSKRGWTTYQKAVEVARDLGATVINLLGHYPPIGISMVDWTRLWTAPIFKTNMPTEPDFWIKTWENYVSLMGKCVDLAKENGLRVSLEPHPFMIVSNTDSALRLFDAVGSESLGVTFDTALFKQSNEVTEIAILKMGKRMFNVHISDSLGNFTSPLHLTIGRGNIYWEGVLKALKTVGYDSFLELELMQMITDEESFRIENQKSIDNIMEAGKRAEVFIE